MAHVYGIEGAPEDPDAFDDPGTLRLDLH